MKLFAPILEMSDMMMVWVENFFDWTVWGWRGRGLSSWLESLRTTSEEEFRPEDEIGRHSSQNCTHSWLEKEAQIQMCAHFALRLTFERALLKGEEVEQ